MEAPPSEMFRGVPTVTLLVGEEKVVYHVHQSVLCDVSKVFKAAFSGQFSEASDRSMSLPDDETEAVERFIQWLYSSRLSLTKPTTIESSDKRYSQLAKLNTLADKYDIVRLKNTFIDELFEMKKAAEWQKVPNKMRPPQIPIIKYIYANTNEQSSFRKLLVAHYCFHIESSWYDQKETRQCLAEVPEFSIDLAIALGTRIGFPDRKSMFSTDKTQYYEEV